MLFELLIIGPFIMSGSGNEHIEQHVLEKFDIIQKLGMGAYGIVWKAVRRKDERLVAVKKVFDAFHNKTDSQR